MPGFQLPFDCILSLGLFECPCRWLMHAEHPEPNPECQKAGDRDEDHGRDAQDENRDEPPSGR